LSGGCQYGGVTRTQGPHELEFVVRVPPTGTVVERPDYDLYRPDGLDDPLPAVVFVPGPLPAEWPIRARGWPMFQGYGRLVAGRGALGFVLDRPYHAMGDWPAMAEDLAATIEAIRALDEVDAERIAVWAFSGGGLLVGRWLADSPAWLRCLALTYPVLATPDTDGPTPPADLVRPGRPLVLTRVGREQPDRRATVEAFLSRADATGTAVRIIDVPDGQHGFDLADHTDQSRRAVIEATDLVVGHLRD
jgi:dienelactone hydrolase